MKFVRSGVMTLVVAGSLALAIALFLLPGRRDLISDAYVLFLGGVGVLLGVRATRRLEREVYLSLGSSFYLHHRMRPVLREIAAHRMLTKHGVDLDGKPEAAAALLGEPAWSWLRPDRSEPRDRWATGPQVDELHAVVDAVERI